MEDNRKSLYYLEKVDDASGFERAVASIKGVSSSHLDEKNLTLEYEIDEWASDYDVFTAIMDIVDNFGAVIDFERGDEEEKKKQDLLNAEQQENKPVSKVKEKQEELPAEIPEEEVEEDKKDKPKKEKKKISENKMRFFELCFAVVCFILGMVIKQDMVAFVFLAMSFAVAGYDALYEAYVKITKKVIISEELIISLSALFCILLGEVSYAVVAMVLYSIVNYARKIITLKMEKRSANWENPEKVMKVSEKGLSEINFDDVALDDEISFSHGERVVFDGVLTSENAKVTTIDGAERNLKMGDTLYAGEIASSNVDLKVTAKDENLKYGKYNQFITGISKKTNKVASFAKSKEQIYNIIVLGVCLLIAFVLPVFSKTYVDGLYRWGYTAVIIAGISGLSYYVFASFANINSAVKASVKSGAFVGGFDEARRISKAKGLYIDESVLFDENGLLKEDCRGAVHELKDDNVKDITIALTKSDEECEEICKKLNVASYLNRNSKEEKISALADAVKKGYNVAVSSELSKEIQDKIATDDKKALKKMGAIICFNCDKEGYNGDGAIMHDKIAYLPYLVKLAKRTSRISNATLITGLLVKLIICVLACFSLAELWWAVLCDSAVNVISAVIAFLNGNEIY